MTAKKEIAQLKKDIKDLKENIEVRKEIGVSYAFEGMLLKAWERRLKYLETHHNRNLT
jgi:hypothetical protein